MRGTHKTGVCATFLLCLTLGAALDAVRAASPPDSGCLRAAGLLDGIQIDSESVESATPDQISLRRGGASLQVLRGMQLCAGDQISATVNVVLRLGKSREAETEITLYPNTTVELTDPSSLFLRLGRLFASLHGFFEVKTDFARLGAKGTEFQVEVISDRLVVIHLKGELEVSPAEDERPTLHPGESRQSVQGPWALELVAAAWRQQKAPNSAQAASLRLEPLSRLMYQRKAGAQPQVAGIDERTTRSVVDRNSEVILLTRPPIPHQNLIQVYASREQRSRDYREARFQTVWSPEKRNFFEQLGNVYVDWAEAEKAVRAYGEAEGLQRSKPHLALYYNNLGNAYRLAGQPQVAEGYYKLALEADSHFAFPYNGLGDVYHDLAAAEFDRGNPSAARERLAQARRYYEKSLDRSLWGKEGGSNRAVPLYNLGETFLLLAEIESGDPAVGAEQLQSYYRAAERGFTEALREAEDYPFAHTGLGRLQVARARLYEKLGDHEQARLNSAVAFREFQIVLERYPKFAPSHLGLGEFFEQMGQSKDALAAFRRATELDPRYAQAHYKTATALDRVGRSAEAMGYYQTYLRVESPLFREGHRAQQAGQRIAEIASADSRPTRKGQVGVPPLIGLSVAQANDVLRDARLRMGRKHTERADAPRNSVLHQQPQPGTSAAVGSEVEVWLSSGPGPSEGGTQFVPVPSVVGLKTWEASLALSVKKLGMREEQAGPSDQPGRVLRQEPAAGAQVPQGTEVVVYVSRSGRPSKPPGLEPTLTGTVPNVVGLTIDQARAAVENARLQLYYQNIDPIDTSKTLVTTQSLPPGSQVSIGSTLSVGIAPPKGRSTGPYIGRGRATLVYTTVPQLVNLPIDRARVLIGNAGLAILQRSGQASKAAGIVQNQDPPAGRQVPRGSTVTVYVSFVIN